MRNIIFQLWNTLAIQCKDKHAFLMHIYDRVTFEVNLRKCAGKVNLKKSMEKEAWQQGCLQNYSYEMHL